MCVLYWFILQLVRAYKWLSQPLTIFTERKLSVKHIGLQMWSHAHWNQYIDVRLRTPAQNSARELRPQKESMWCRWTENIYSRQWTNIRTERELQSHCSNQCAQSISFALKSSAQWFTVLCWECVRLYSYGLQSIIYILTYSTNMPEYGMRRQFSTILFF